PFDQSTSSSRTVFTMGGAARRAAHQIRQQLFGIGSRGVEAGVEDFGVGGGFFEGEGGSEERRRNKQLFAARVWAAGREHGGELRQSDDGGIGSADGEGQGFGLFFPVSVCSRGGGGYGDREGSRAAGGIGGGCGQGGQSSAMSSTERGIDDHVVGVGAVCGDGGW